MVVQNESHNLRTKIFMTTEPADLGLKKQMWYSFSKGQDTNGILLDTTELLDIWATQRVQQVQSLPI